MPYKTRILLIEDEEDIAALIKLQAEVSGYSLHVEIDGINGYLACERILPDLIILDVMLPGENGFDVCRKIKNNPRLKHVPVLMLSAKDKEIDIILGLELGADDYVSKPFSPKVLFSKVKAILRRSAVTTKTKKNFSFGEFNVDVDRYLLYKNNLILSVTLSEFGILKRLLANKGKVLTRNQLIDDVNNDDAYIVDRNIDVHIASLRKKLGPNFDWIETVRGIGYRFRDLLPKVGQ
ncbi:DNA-binding response regulator [Candidatus Aerophobetes bacterium]|uniref:DNA-binding response regulator n=1 Tax=Aerophobetes bacterium TaxID=2030807 RepID=A0A2A4X4Q4_UNCAE|nr:MAG: DNA-binding response regulator [Candidatus Aerophobetes bacterium]